MTQQHKDEITSWFDLNSNSPDTIEKERKKAQELLNHIDHIRTQLANKITQKRMYSK